jgi:hypothetical protein
VPRVKQSQLARSRVGNEMPQSVADANDAQQDARGLAFGTISADRIVSLVITKARPWSRNELSAVAERRERPARRAFSATYEAGARGGSSPPSSTPAPRPH